MIVEDGFEAATGIDAQIGVAERGHRQRGFDAERLAHKVAGEKQTDNLFAAVSRRTRHLQHAGHDIGADVACFALPYENLPTRYELMPRNGVECVELVVGQARAQGRIAHSAVGTSFWD